MITPKRNVVTLCGVVLLVVVAAFFLLGASASKTGEICRVVLRRDALGLAGTTGCDLNTDVFNGAQASLVGKLVSTNGQWVVIDSEYFQMPGAEVHKHQYWVPMSAVLVLDFEKPTAASK